MPEQAPQEYWVDWYLRDELSAEDEEAFETALLESPALQQELETALALRAALARDADDQSRQEVAAALARRAYGGRVWQPLALAASLTLAVLSSFMWWRSGGEAEGLEHRLQALAQPRGEVLTVALPIMRSAGGTPEVIVQKPAGRAAIVLDIELGLQARQEERLRFALIDPEGAQLLSWQAAPSPDGRATAIIAGEQIPAARLWLQIASDAGETLERRLLEFRAAE